jgi:hypothetical protein
MVSKKGIKVLLLESRRGAKHARFAEENGE